MAESEIPAARGVSRMFDNEKAVLVSFDRALTDDELRSLHDRLRAARAPDGVVEALRGPTIKPDVLRRIEGWIEFETEDESEEARSQREEAEAVAMILGWYKRTRALHPETPNGGHNG